MGLDATVYCNCFETGNLKAPVPFSTVKVDDNGSLDYVSEDLQELLLFDEWLLRSACEHPKGVLLHHRIGNIGLVAILREEVKRDAGSFPVLLNAVLYSGTHGGDYLDQNQILDVKAELANLERFTCSNSQAQEFLDSFRLQMSELVEAALRVQKPISF